MSIFSSDGGKSQRNQLLFRAVSSTLQAFCPAHITFHWKKPNPFCQCKEYKETLEALSKNTSSLSLLSTWF